MAITAAITLTPATALINQDVRCTLTITNSTSSIATVSYVNPTSIFTGASVPMPSAVGSGVVNLGPGATTTIAASGTLVLGFDQVYFAPSTGPLGAGFGTYSIGAIIGFSDGTSISATTGAVFVNPIALPAAQQ